MKSILRFRFLSAVFLLVMCCDCKYLTPQTESELTKVGTAVLCSIEHLEVDDAALNELCNQILPRLTPQQRAAVKAIVDAKKAAKEAQ